MSGCFPGLIRYGGGESKPSATLWGDLESPEADWDDEIKRALKLDKRKHMSNENLPRIHVNDIHPGR